MKRFIYLFAVLILSSSIQALAQPAEYITIGKDAFAFHEDIFHEHRIKVEPLYVNDVEILIELIGIPNVAKINALHLQIRRSIGLGDAAAVYRDGFRTIVYDPIWAKTASAEFYLALGHEAGHHFCGHTLGQSAKSQWEKELEADRFGGASIRRFEVYHGRSFIREVMEAAISKYPESGSNSHPPRTQRLAAIRRGYEEGSPCGNLAPVNQRGFSSGPR